MNASYAASNAAAIVVARIAANELGRFGINVNSVVPGPVRTELLDLLERQNPDIIRDMEERSARGRIAVPTDIANATIFLCSGLAESITDQSINVDYGLLWV
jgi:NAD(P)-dependent dehydrogenase (short-subunit alcohol dehydrogenase family)